MLFLLILSYAIFKLAVLGYVKKFVSIQFGVTRGIATPPGCHVIPPHPHFVVLCQVSLYLDCSQPSIFSYFYSMVERLDRIARELDARAKRKP